MAKIEHIARARGYYLNDGDLNRAILNLESDAVAGVGV
jgi:hypothetical protein